MINKVTTFSLIAIFAISSFYFILHQKEESLPDLDYVKDMDFKRFMGVWYNIASLPNIIQKGCKCPQSVDTLVEDLVIHLSQSCMILGKNITSNSKAVAKNYGFGDWTNWNGPMSAPYWIINLDNNYQWAIIGQPSRKGFWILSRKPTLNKQITNSLIQWGKQQKFDLSSLEFSDQSCFLEGKIILESSVPNLMSE